MQAASPIPRQSVGRTFLVAISLLGLIALGQLGTLTWRAFYPQPSSPALPAAAVARSDAPPGPAHAPAPAQSPQSTEPTGPAALAQIRAPGEGAPQAAKVAPAQLVQPAPTAQPSQPSAPKTATADAEKERTVAEAEMRLLAMLPKPTPVPVRREVTPESRTASLVGLARTLRERGDTSTALTRLREAQVILPQNPLIISEMAITYEKMGLTDKAIDQWRRIYEFGEKAGIYYAAAEAKLRAFQLPDPSASLNTAADPAQLIPDGGLQPEPAAAASTGRGPVLSLGDVGTTEDTGNSEPLRRLKLRVPIQARPGVRIDVHDAVIQVYFYDQLGDGSLVETNANVNYAWVRRTTGEGEPAAVDWSTPKPEVLEVSYSQPEPEPAPISPKSSKTAKAKKGTKAAGNSSVLNRRNYFGYVVRVYYKGELNAVLAEPVKLLKQFPPPATWQSSDLPQ